MTDPSLPLSPLALVSAPPPRAADALRVHLGAGDLADPTRLHAVLARDLALPDYYGRNFDALLDVLSDAEVLAGRQVAIIVDDAARALELAPDALTRLAAVVRDVAERFAPAPSPVVLLLVATTRTAPSAPDADACARAWIAAWNARDLDGVLAHYADDVVLMSPRAAVVVPSSGGVIYGKDALTRYWRAALALVPDLHFTLEAIYTTVGGVTIAYRNQRGEHATETLLFDHAGLVTRVVVAYRPADGSPPEPGAPT